MLTAASIVGNGCASPAALRVHVNAVWCMGPAGRAKPTPRRGSYDSSETKVARRVKLAHNKPRPSRLRASPRIAAGITDHVSGLEAIVGLLDHSGTDTHAAAEKESGHD